MKDLAIIVVGTLLGFAVLTVSAWLWLTVPAAIIVVGIAWGIASSIGNALSENRPGDGRG